MKIPASDDRPHAVVIKGIEIVSEDGFTDPHNEPRTQLRECWWRSSTREIPRDKTIVWEFHNPAVTTRDGQKYVAITCSALRYEPTELSFIDGTK